MVDLIVGIIMFVLIFGFPLALILGGLVIGRILEKRHFASIRVREAAHLSYPAVPTQTVPTPSWDPNATVTSAHLVTASVVVSLDHFKKILAPFRKLFGGNIRSYESLLDRAKREAILRLKERAPEGHIIVNLRLITSNIASIHDRRQKVGGVEVLAFGTVVQYSVPPPFGGADT